VAEDDSYPPQFQWLHVVSTAGASLLGFGLVFVLVYLLVSLKYGPVAGANPWGSRGYA
jgi:cytochrome c oxidase subunit I